MSACKTCGICAMADKYNAHGHNRTDGRARCILWDEDFGEDEYCSRWRSVHPSLADEEVSFKDATLVEGVGSYDGFKVGDLVKVGDDDHVVVAVATDFMRVIPHNKAVIV